MSFITYWLGIFFCLVFIYFIYRIRCCSDKCFAYCKTVNEYSGSRGTRTYAPVFVYNYQGRQYEIECRQVTLDPFYFKAGTYHTIYVNPKRPEFLVWRKKLSMAEYLSLVFGLLFVIAGASGALK